MAVRDAELGRDRDFERFLTFIDAIVAIAVTLLVLPLVDIVRDLTKHPHVTTLLSDHRDDLGAFFLSFLVISNLWLTQHRIVRNVVASNTALTRLLMLWSLTIVFMPFPTALVASRAGVSGQAATKLLYLGTLIVSSGVLGLVCLVLDRHEELRDSAQAPDPAGSFSAATSFVIALAVMLIWPGLSYWPMLLLLIDHRLAVLFRWLRSLSAPRSG